MQQDRVIDLDRTTNTAGAELCTAPDKGASPVRRLELTAYVSAKDVQQALGCSMSQAYVHLRRATGKTGRGLLRAPVDVWEAYSHRLYGVDGAAVNKVGSVRGGRSRSSITLSADKDGERIQAIEKRLDEASSLLDELRGAVAQYRRDKVANARTS
jgi:hypothetical protein